MKKTVVILVISLHVIISASEFSDNEKLTALEQNCTSIRTRRTSGNEYYELDSVTDAKPAGYKAYLHLFVVAKRTASITLSSTKPQEGAPFYDFGFDTKHNHHSWIFRNNKEVRNEHVPFASSELMEVVMAITNDNLLTVTIDGKVLYAYNDNETRPFMINYFDLAVVPVADKDEFEARYFFNCSDNPLVPNPNKLETLHCGKRTIEHNSLVTNGLRTREGDWPWHSAIFHTQDDLRRYKCGGTLITSTAVLTSAHCLYEFGHLVIPHRVIVSMGKRHLHLSSRNTQEFLAHRLIVHNGYNPNVFLNDIGIIRLATEATFSPYVQPICLWDATRSTLEEVIGRNGAVVGWGLNERDQLPDELDLAYMPVVSTVDCLLSDPDFFVSFINHGMFCAGFKNGTGACNGDSGGGMYFLENGHFTLRGIVSQTTARSGEENFCDSQHYVVFTDAAAYSNWILENIK